MSTIKRCTIIGGGVAGSAAAIALRKIAGIRHVRIIDSVPEVSDPHVGAGFVLQPTALTVLDRLDLLQKTATTCGTPITRLWGVNHNSSTVLDLRYEDM